MAKAPASQFYWADWLRDTELQAVSASSRGIWINLLAHMWFAEKRGIITGTKEELTRLGNCSEKEFENFMHEIARKRFGNKHIKGGEITLESRRMIADELARQTTNERVKKHRCNTVVTDMKRECNNAPSSSSSSSVSKEGERSASYPKNPRNELADKLIDEWVKACPSRPSKDYVEKARVRVYESVTAGTKPDAVRFALDKLKQGKPLGAWDSYLLEHGTAPTVGQGGGVNADKLQYTRHRLAYLNKQVERDFAEACDLDEIEELKQTLFEMTGEK